MFPTHAKSHSPTVLSTAEAHKQTNILQAFSLEFQTKYCFWFVCFSQVKQTTLMASSSNVSF